MRQMGRHPEIGDMLIVRPNSRRSQHIVGADVRDYIGLVYKIECSEWGHQENVHVQWSDTSPPDYNHRHGYSGINIHNLRSEFRIIRNGTEVQ